MEQIDVVPEPDTTLVNHRIFGDIDRVQGKTQTPSWIGNIRPLPGGKITRIIGSLVLVIALVDDAQRPEVDLHTVPGIVDFAAPFLPVMGLLISPLMGAVAWFVAMGSVFALGPSNELLFALLIATVAVLLAVTVLFPMRQAVWFFGAVIGLNVMAKIIYADDGFTFLVFIVPLYLVVGASGIAINRQINKIRQHEVEIKDLQEHQKRVRNEERQELAYELHDIVAHDITIIAMQARRAEFVDDPEKIQQILEGIGTAAQQTLQDLRSLLMLLKTSDEAVPVSQESSADQLLETPAVSGETTTAVGFIKDLNNVVEALRKAGFSVEQTTIGEVAKVPASVRQALRRTVREVGTNILKHGEIGGPVTITLRISDQCVELRAINTVSAKPPIMSTQTGLEALKARVEVFGGTAKAGLLSQPGSGSKIWETLAEIPLKRERGGPVSTRLNADYSYISETD